MGADKPAQNRHDTRDQRLFGKGTIGKGGGIGTIEKIGIWTHLADFPLHGKPAKAAVKDENEGRAGPCHLRHAESMMHPSAVWLPDCCKARQRRDMAMPSGALTDVYRTVHPAFREDMQ